MARKSEAEASSSGEVTTTITATTTLTVPAHPKVPTYAELNPRSEATDFFGPIGTTVVSLGCPFIVYFLFFTCNEVTGCHPTNSRDWKLAFEGIFGGWDTVSGRLWDWKAAGVYLAWYAFCVVCAVVLPGDKVEGTLMRDGKRKVYTMNGEGEAILHSEQR
jgi:delta14-sterol reductase